MADYSYVLRAPYEVADASLPQVGRDPLITGANRGLRFLYDLAFAWCYPGGASAGRPAPGAPADGAVIRDIAENADGAFRKAAGQVVGFSAGGFDLKGVTGRGCNVEVPASVNADLWAGAPAGAAAPGVSQAYLEAHYFIWPDTSGWQGHATNVYAPIFCTAGTDAAPSSFYGATPERVWCGLMANGTMQLIFQLAIGNTAGTHYQQLVVASVDANRHRGLLTQVSAWRKADGTIAVRLRSSAGTTIVTGAAAQNASSYAASRTKVGITPLAQWESSGMNLASSPFKLFRGFIENLARSGRDPVTVLDADWTRVQARIAASAAANGGASQIFV